MYAYRIVIDINELNYYKNNIIYFDNEPIFKINSNSLYKVNTFPNDNRTYKYFYYYPEDAFEIAKIILNINNSINQLYILEYYLDNNEIIDKVGFGNYKNLIRKKYIPKDNQYKLFPFANSTYPVLEIRLNKNNIIKPTQKIFTIKSNSIIPTSLNKSRKLREYILYKIYLEKVICEFNLNYPHKEDGIMIISKYEGNIKELKIPKKYQRLIC